eukprot:NODE_456_length_7225_cov_1.202498.p2 type:complete len:318 gc:universal NODE_456_length_7225_cov_1.202498:1877-924(-)
MNSQISKLIQNIPTSRVALSKSITLIESSQLQDQKMANILMNDIKCAPQIKIGWSGSPGVGKSSFIERIGLELVKSHQLAVLAIDPSSHVSGGSILGDKTRMMHLSNHPKCFIRPSPNKQMLGGVAKSTQSVIKLCEYAKFDRIFIETVGVGQSEHMVAEMVDIFILLCPPAGGDELQGIKKGIVEMADLVIINKSDGHLERAAKEAQSEYTSALKYLRHGHWKPPVLRASAHTGFNMELVISTINEFIQQSTKNGYLERKRRRQRKQWMWRIAQDLIQQELTDLGKSDKITEIENRVMDNQLMPSQGAHELLNMLK